ncbi:transcriptional regulator [Testudinibacter sp. TR-2022]|uniref:transcriptional regulator n=1 Tax=Testudinibacter sp. TR-2022 TaxID=2585029 RepID=UPI0011193F94|nr:helix-turn-helix transcriptional regulator [Testudinibacter sp. TR-2022]TNH07026.1 helix-turn-helix transcriptional regulator [Pasteurellaceae bacterium Phil11]TNH21768.1 helix-turn-helix transcriptional regulator [Testudinibacter sp. TR-2022]TNH29080.1 helix-turn-helix transcriptional regulator [Testudinibacter sp. TR-2022]
MKLQYIQDNSGKNLFVVLPIEEYQKLQNYKQIATLDDDNESNWEEVPYQASSNDDVTIPHEVMNIMFEQNISLLAAWRQFRGLSQYTVAEQTGLTQSAISQAEKKGSKPQQKTCERLAVVYGCLAEQLVM